MTYGKFMYPASRITCDPAERVRTRGTRAIGNTTEHTDLSAELPSARAYVDVPLEGDWHRISWHRSRPVAYPAWPPGDGPEFGEDDDDDDKA
jgi:hypothetical protein